MREIGLSDKYFYYTSSGKGSTMDIRLVITLNSPVNRGALIDATNEALKLYPEYSARPVLKCERLYYEENTQPVALLPLSSRYDFSSTDMNGYLFCFQIDTSDERKIVFSVYHGLSDWNGLNRFIRAIMCCYAVHIKGLDDNYFGDEIRTHAPSDWNNPSTSILMTYTASKVLCRHISPKLAGKYSHHRKTFTPSITPLITTK